MINPNTIGTESLETTLGRIIGSYYAQMDRVEKAFKLDRSNRFSTEAIIVSSIMYEAIKAWAKKPSDIEWAIEFYSDNLRQRFSDMNRPN